MKLSNQKRDNWSKRISDLITQKSFDDLDKEENKIATDIYNDFVNNDLPHLQKLSDWFVNTDSSVTIQNGDNRRERIKSTGKKFFLRAHYYDNEILIYKTNKFFKDFQRIVKEYEKLKKEKEDLRIKISGILYGCSTLKQALEALPELEKFIPEVLMQKENKNLPMIVPSDLLKAMHDCEIHR